MSKKQSTGISQERRTKMHAENARREKYRQAGMSDDQIALVEAEALAASIFEQSEEEKAERAEDAAELAKKEKQWRSITPSANHYAHHTIEEIVAHTIGEYGDALIHFMKELDYDRAEAKQRAAEVWRAILPDLITKENTLAYIACVSMGLRIGILNGADAKTMMFIAQTQLSAFKVDASAASKPGLAPSVPDGAQPGLFAGETDPGRFDSRKVKGGTQ